MFAVYYLRVNRFQRPETFGFRGEAQVIDVQHHIYRHRLIWVCDWLVCWEVGRTTSAECMSCRCSVLHVLHTTVEPTPKFRSGCTLSAGSATRSFCLRS